MREKIEHPTKWLNNFKKGVEHGDGEAPGRRDKDTYIVSTTFDYESEERRRDFLKRAMFDLFNYNSCHDLYLPRETRYDDGRREFGLKEIVYSYYDDETGKTLLIAPRGRFPKSGEDLQYTKKCVYYNSHFYLEIDDPTRLKFSGDPTYFLLTLESLGEELSRIGEIRPSFYHKTLLEDIKDLEDIWKERGFVLRPVEYLSDPSRCKYCGEKIEDIDRSAGRRPMFCDSECKQKYLRYKKRIERYITERGSPDFDLQKLENTYRSIGITPKEIESQFMTTRCRYCGGVVSGDKREGSEFCCESCKNAFKYRLKKERKTKPDLTPKDLVEILKIERTQQRVKDIHIKYLKSCIVGGVSLDDIPRNSLLSHLKEYFKEEFSDLIVKITRENKKEKNDPGVRSENLESLTRLIRSGSYLDRSPGSKAFYLRGYFGDEFEDLVTKITKEIKKERRLNPDLIPEGYLKMKKENIEILEECLREETPLDDVTPGSWLEYVRDFFGDEYESILKELQDKIRDELYLNLLYEICNEISNPITILDPWSYCIRGIRKGDIKDLVSKYTKSQREKGEKNQ